jgi:hypothetical protein
MSPWSTNTAPTGVMQATPHQKKHLIRIFGLIHAHE